MTDYEKEQADSVVFVLQRKNYGGWSGQLVINGDSASACNGPGFWGVFDTMVSGAFHDDVSGDAIYTLGEGKSSE